MPVQKDVKRLIRDRQAKTGEAYSTARAHVMSERAARLAPEAATPTRHEAVILKVNQTSARVRILGEEGQVTFRSGDASGLVPVVPGHVVTLVVEKRWTWRDAYASGKIENPRIDVQTLGLEPLVLEGGDLHDLREYSEPYGGRDAYSRLWRKLTAKPRPAYEFDAVAWGQLPGCEDPEDNPTCNAAELRALGRDREAHKLLMNALGVDLRCLDAHAHLGNAIFDRSPERAMAHYEIGVRIGELSLPAGVGILLPWGMLYNRPFLRCLHGFGLCQWRLGKLAEAQKTFERILSFNPNDNQGARFLWEDVRNGRTWDEMEAREEAASAAPRQRRQS
ncbi:hypothetical protein BH11MYX4_BH11MYX4_05360 [soil metagenome]